MDELVTYANKLSEVGFPALLIMILYGNYKRVWVWGGELRESKSETSYWKNIAVRLAGMAETSLGIEKSTRLP